jgi:signal transduction histidine kinase
VGASSSGLTPAGRRFAAAAAVALVGIVAGVVANAEMDSRDHRVLRHATAGVNGAVDARVTSVSRRVTQYAGLLERTPTQRLSTRLAAAPRTDFARVQVVPARPGAANATGDMAVANAEDIARDSAQPVAVVVQGPTSAQLVVAWPIYTGPLPAQTQLRREQSAGWILGTTPLTTVLGPILRIFEPLNIGSALSTAAAGPGPVDSVLTDGASLRVTSYPKQSRLALVLIGVVTGVATLVIIGLAIARRRSDRETATVQDRLRRQVALVSEVSLTVQESLDIGLLLPAALSQISDAHDLSYISVVTGNSQSGGNNHVLSIGRRPRLPGQRWDVGASFASAGQVLRLPLQRASRTLGYVEAVASRDLGADDIASIRSTADLLANALHNADLYEREQENVRRLRDLDEMKDDFLATVSHELRTPLSVLVGFMSLLSRKWDRLSEHDRREAVDKSQAHVTSLAHLVNDLLDFVSERRARTPMPELMRLQHSVGVIVEQLRPLCARHQLDVQLDQEVLAWTDPRAVERIIGNLLSNAAKYAPAGSTITVRAEVTQDAAVVTIADQGPGISPEEQQRIFERFYRGESDAARSTRGSGIGLAVVNEWMRVVGARLDIVSVVGEGTRMSLHFPRRDGQTLDRPGTINWLEPAMAQRSITHEQA